MTNRSFNIWHYKPWWCQPWSIVLTGITLIGGSGWLFHRLWLTLLLAIPVLIWMGFFLLIYPRLMRDSVEVEMAAAAGGDRRSE